ncbi:translationally-controlled tumor [Fusarium longipes]|uniref:Translationally-controlled tumor protein homolog n=1 Tax=Fusarium longipes TaxID=694270 RepID=A0A395T072_9HYPO|nr:translationally-controlled tumor [Fusarium longipes]
MSQDHVCGDDMISDSYRLKEVDGVVYEVDCSMINTGETERASEDEDEDDDGVQRVNNVIYSFRLQPTQFDKASYVSYLKGYLKKTKEKLQDEGKDSEYITDFTKSAQAFLKTKILPDFSSWEFYTGENQDVDGMVVLLGYREDGTTPYLIFWKDGLNEKTV